MNRDEQNKQQLSGEEACENSSQVQENEDIATDVKPDTDPAQPSDNAVAEIQVKLDEALKQKDEYYQALQRLAAEFENYKKRTAREKEGLYLEIVKDVVKAVIPVLDNLERALGAANTDESCKAFAEGVEMVYKQFKDILKNLGVEEIKSVGEVFNPEVHNAVMHIEDETYGNNTVIEEFLKGYIIQDKVIRHSLVKVAN